MKNSARFVDSFVNDYLGPTRDDFAKNLSKLMVAAREFHAALASDITFATAVWRTHDCIESRRVYVRAIPPFIEGSLNVLRVIPYLYPPFLEQLPKEFTVTFAESVLVFRNRSKAAQAIKDVLTGFGHVSGAEVPHDLMGETGAQNLIATFKLRDALMHPRSTRGMDVSSQDLHRAEAGLLWFEQKFTFVIGPLRDRVEELQ